MAIFVLIFAQMKARIILIVSDDGGIYAKERLSQAGLEGAFEGKGGHEIVYVSILGNFGSRGLVRF